MATLLADSDSDSENQPLMIKRDAKTMAHNSSSSDSDSEPSPPKQRRTAVRSVRGLARLLSQKSEGFSPVSTSESDVKSCSIYSSAASECMKAAENAKLPVKELNENLDVDVEEAKAKIKGKVASRRQAPKPAALIDLGEEEDECNVLESSQSQGRDRSPTPPPAPNLPTKNKRKMKGVVKAIRTLDSVTAKFTREQQYGDEDDCCIVDMISPTSLQKQHDEKKHTVKVRSRSGIQRFMMKRTEDFSEVFRAMAAHEAVDEARLSICREDTPVQPYDTPACIGLRVTDILDVYIRRGREVTREVCAEDDPDAIALRVQGKDPKSRRTINVNKHEPLERLMRRYASIVKVPYSTLSFTFDGETLEPSQSAEDLDLEDDFCIDVAGI